LFYLYKNTNLEANFNPNNKFLGNVVGDDEVLCGDRDVTFDGDPDMFNFETICIKSDVRAFWCAHDRE
jgi:hypothetical protein